MNIYVGSLADGVTEDELKQAFEAHGEVASARIITDKFSGQSRGFGFVEMPNDAEAQAAISAMNGTELKGRRGGGGGGPRRGGGGGGGGPRRGGRGPGGGAPRGDRRPW
jgi:hypothetical protein